MLKQINKLSLLSIILLYLIATTSSCIFSDYELYTLQPDDIRFEISAFTQQHPRYSFEYPRSFALIDWNKEDHFHTADNFTLVEFTRGESKKLMRSQLYVMVFNNELDSYKIDPFGAIHFMVEDEPINDSIEKVEVTVVDVPAQLFIRSAQNENTVNYYLVALFEHSGFNWAICLFGYNEHAEELNEYLSHILDTFTIID